MIQKKKKRHEEECELCRAYASGDQAAIYKAQDEAVRNGEAFEMTDEQLAYFVEHLRPEERRDYDAIREAEGLVAAMAFTLERVLQDAFPGLKVNQPARRLQ